MAGARSRGGDQGYETRATKFGCGCQRAGASTAHHLRIRDREGRLGIIGAAQEITRRRLKEEALNKARSELARFSRVTSLGAMTASIAHEVNQPLSAIITNAHTCLRMPATNPPQVESARETARRTIRDGNSMSEVITRLRALFGKKESTTEPVNLNDAGLELIALSIAQLQTSASCFMPNLPTISHPGLTQRWNG